MQGVRRVIPNAGAIDSANEVASSVTMTKPIRELSSMSSKRSPAASLTHATFWRVRSGVASAAVSAPPVPSRRFTLMPTTSACRAAMERTRLPPPPTISGGPGFCTGRGASEWARIS